MKNKNIFKINIIYFIAITCVAIIFLLGYLGILQNEILTSVLIQIVVMLAMPMLLYSLICRRNFKQTLNDAGIKKISGKILLISIALGFVLYFINTFVANAFASVIAAFGFESLSSQASTKITYGLLLKDLVLSCILPGICEEFLHRGIMLHAGKKHVNTKYCLIISSILFGLMHLNIRQFFYAAILGFLMGYVTLVADSIIPSIIIHFMNNFLSNYMFYGTHLNWPFARFINAIESYFMGNMFMFVSGSVVAVFGLIVLYNYLTKLILKERTKRDIKAITKELKLNNLTLIQAQIKINQVNEILKTKSIAKNNNKCNYVDKIFLISSIVLGTLITISSFIWGVI